MEWWVVERGERKVKRVERGRRKWAPEEVIGRDGRDRGEDEVQAAIFVPHTEGSSLKNNLKREVDRITKVLRIPRLGTQADTC